MSSKPIIVGPDGRPLNIPKAKLEPLFRDPIPEIPESIVHNFMNRLTVDQQFHKVAASFIQNENPNLLHIPGVFSQVIETYAKTGTLDVHTINQIIFQACTAMYAALSLKWDVEKLPISATKQNNLPPGAEYTSKPQTGWKKEHVPTNSGANSSAVPAGAASRPELLREDEAPASKMNIVE